MGRAASVPAAVTSIAVVVLVTAIVWAGWNAPVILRVRAVGAGWNWALRNGAARRFCDGTDGECSGGGDKHRCGGVGDYHRVGWMECSNDSEGARGRCWMEPGALERR